MSLKRRADRGNRWQARYRDSAGKEHARLFERKVDAEKWLNSNKAAVDRGDWIDPAGAKLTFRDVAEQWRAAQVHRDTTRAQVETHLRRHAYPTFGDREIGTMRKTEIQAWVTQLGADLQPATVRVVYSFLAAIMRSAVDDDRLRKSPCINISLPDVQPKRVEPIATELVELIAAKVPEKYRALVMLGAGTGVRQGEALGLTVDRIDFLRRSLTIDRQLVTLARQEPHLTPPKTEKSNRVIPLPQVVIDALAAHLAASPAGANGFVFTVDGKPIRRTTFSTVIWRPAAKAALAEYRAALEKAAAEAQARGETPPNVKVPESLTFHDLRHYYASLLIRHGESVKTVQARLGHASASETLDTYSHLWPDSDGRTREAVDGVLGQPKDDQEERKAE